MNKIEGVKRLAMVEGYLDKCTFCHRIRLCKDRKRFMTERDNLVSALAEEGA